MGIREFLRDNRGLEIHAITTQPFLIYEQSEMHESEIYLENQVVYDLVEQINPDEYDLIIDEEEDATKVYLPKNAVCILVQENNDTVKISYRDLTVYFNFDDSDINDFFEITIGLD